MDTVLIAGLFGLIGAIVGSVLTGIVQRVGREQASRADRLDSAIRSVAVALASSQFVWSVDKAGAPRSFSREDEAESSRSMYLKGIERHMTALHEAKRDLAIVTADGVDTGLPSSILHVTPSLDDFERAYEAMTKLRGAKRRVFT